MQARMGSTRLPNKSTMPLAGIPLVSHCMTRAKQARLIDLLVLAIPDTPENEILGELADQCGVAVLKGSENDLVDRFYQAASQFKADIVVRICSDNPLVQPSEIDRIIQFYCDHPEIDFASNVGPLMNNNYPDGLGAEVFSFISLKWIHENISDPRMREHIHEGFYGNPDKFQAGTISCPKEFARPDIVLDINTKEEYEFIGMLFSDLYNEDEFLTIDKIIPWYEKHDELKPETYKKGND